MAEENKNPRQLNIHVPDQVATGVYSNFVIIGHSQNEFVTDFVSMIPAAMSKPTVAARVVMSPQNAKRLLAALNENVRKYEATFGTIQVQEAGSNPNDFPPPSFGGPAGIA